MFGIFSPNSTFTHGIISVILEQCSRRYLDQVGFRAFLITNLLLLLPLLILIIFISVQRWMRNRRSSSDSANAGHSDVFTYHMVAMEMCTVVIVVRFLLCPFTNEFAEEFLKWIYTFWCVKVKFLLLTCVEFHLAVVHPVVYLKLKSSVWIRSLSAAVVWLLCVLCGVVSYWCSNAVTMVLCLCLLVLDLVVVSFCCISVLWTLKRPGPGENAEDKVDPSKQRAFRTIVKIMMVIWLCLAGQLVFYIVEALQSQIVGYFCMTTSITFWLTLPSSFLLPLLFLQRAGRLPCRRA